MDDIGFIVDDSQNLNYIFLYDVSHQIRNTIKTFIQSDKWIM